MFLRFQLEALRDKENGKRQGRRERTKREKRGREGKVKIIAGHERQESRVGKEEMYRR